MSKRNLRGSRAIITGASSGIGWELALEFARRGASVCVMARREERLAELVAELNAIREASFPESPEHFYVAGDVCSADDRERTLTATESRFGGIDVLVNNAGAGATLAIEETSDELACEMFDLNFLSPFELTKGALPALKASAESAENRRAGIRPFVVNVSSIVGVRGTPYFGVYGASKAALLTLTDAWRVELAGTGVEFLTVTPGTTSSEFFDKLREDRLRPKLPKHRAATPKEVALAIADAVEKGKKRLVPASKSASLLSVIARFCPGFTDGVMARFVVKE